MTTDRFQRLLPVTGVIAGLALIGGLVLSGSEVSESATAAQIAEHYRDNNTQIVVASLVCAQLFSLMLLFFTAGLRSAIRSGEAGESSYSTVVTIGGTVTALGISLLAFFEFAAADAADRGSSPSVVESLHLLASNAWMPWAVGASALLIGAGLGGLRTVALPRVLSWITLVLGVLAVTPAGALVFAAMPLWLIATGVVLARRDRRAVAVPAGSAPSAA